MSDTGFFADFLDLELFAKRSTAIRAPCDAG